MDRNTIINDPETAERYALDGRQVMIRTAMPGIVQSVNLTAMTCVVQPAIKGVQTDESGNQTYVSLPLLLDVPICFPSAGGFTLTLPIKIGDEVLVIISDRCIDAWWQLGGIQNPMEFRLHDLSDGFAIPGPRSQPRVVGGISSTNAQLRNDAGTCYLEITAGGGINLIAPSGVSVTGNLAVTGAITATAEVIAKFGTGLPIPLSTHVHSGVTSGGSNTGAPL